MPFQAILIDRVKLTEHGNLTEGLTGLLLSLGEKDIKVWDTAEFESAEDMMKKCHVTAGDSLIIADCEETVQQAFRFNTAVLGYEPRGSHRIQSHLAMIVEGFEETDYVFLERVYQRFHNIPWEILETERCILREMTLEDLDALYELYRPEAMTLYMNGLHENRKEQEKYTRAYIENMYRFYGYGIWVVIEKKSGQLIGRAGFDHYEEDGEVQLELGYAIAVDKQKQGYAAEVCRGILKYAFEALEVPSVCCLIQKENTASIRLAEKLGFRWEKNIVCNGKELQYWKIWHK